MQYTLAAQMKKKQCLESRRAVILSIESSCDETAAAVVRDGREVLSNIVWSQIDLHREYGGVVPELASRDHVEKIGLVVDQALKQSGVSLPELHGVAVTDGPGLVGCLLVGVSFAKGLAFAQRLPLIPVNHIEGHICANYLADCDLHPPFICLVASGGHSHIIRANEDFSYDLLGRTRDDAAGEAFDKAARALGLPYPGGPELEKLARKGNAEAYVFHSAFNEQAHYDVSFSGLKTALINILHTAKQTGETINRADLAASFQKAVTNILCKKSINACIDLNCQTIALAGGVAANSVLRSAFEERSREAGLRFVCPPMEFCTDNAAMIGSAGFLALMRGQTADLDHNAYPGRKLGV